MTVKQDACAELLQFPLIGDTYGYAYFIDSEGRVRVFDSNKSTDAAFKRVQAYGVGKFCRWMLTEESLIIRFLDGKYMAKRRSDSLLPWGGRMYGTVFSFQTDLADLIVVCTPSITFVFRVSNGAVEEESFPIDAYLYCGLGLSGSDYVLFGQTKRSKSLDSGRPLAIVVNAGRFNVQDISRNIGAAGVEIEGVVAVLGKSDSATLICSETYVVLGLNEYELGPIPSASEHENFWLVAWPLASGTVPKRLERVAFIGSAGPEGEHIAYFQDRNYRKDVEWACLVHVTAEGLPRYLSVVGLNHFSTIRNVRFDPLLGWFGIAEQHNERRDQYLMLSKDGLDWTARKIES